MKNEQKLSKEQKFSKFQRDLEKQKGIMIRALVFVIVLETIMLIIVSNKLMEYICYGFVFFLLAFFMFQPAIMIMNIVKLEKRLRKKVEEEREYLKGIKEEYLIINSCKFNDIPAHPRDLTKTARYLLSNPKKTPEQIIKDREEELEDLEIQLQVYSKSPEPTFWRYFISWKWLKKVNVQESKKNMKTKIIFSAMMIIILAGCVQVPQVKTGNNQTETITKNGTTIIDYRNGVYYFKPTLESFCDALSLFIEEHKDTLRLVSISVEGHEGNGGYACFEPRNPCPHDSIWSNVYQP